MSKKEKVEEKLKFITEIGCSLRLISIYLICNHDYNENEIERRSSYRSERYTEVVEVVVLLYSGSGWSWFI